ncbi:hypothetical protein TRICI_003630 [Trichomonascus ciferrii]|uniref:glycogenin glucosyltransferase n=1 Tax=Trichomonascus ciferrii TaxID=44093 RepID=A0A642V2I9_9ASCO|nr:hypothetical protein TRICI_003630 [Trichomonascus ciferrii]
MEAYATLLYNDGYLPGALVLGHRLREVSGRWSDRDVVVMITDEVSEDARKELGRVFDRLILVPTLNNTRVDSIEFSLLNRPELVNTYTKVYLWNQTQYEKVVFLDSDVLVVKGIEDLFDLDVGVGEIAAAPDIGWPDIFNSGVFVARPDFGTYEGLKEMAENNESFDGGDQGLLNQYFQGSGWRRIPFTYNVTPSSLYQYTPAFRYFEDRVSIVHFVGNGKPWEQRPSPHVFEQGLSGSRTDYTAQWWHMARRFGVDDYLLARQMQQHHVSLDDTPPMPTAFEPEVVQEQKSSLVVEESQVDDPARFDRFGGYSDKAVETIAPPATRWDATKTVPPIESEPEGGGLQFEPFENAWDRKVAGGTHPDSPDRDTGEKELPEGGAAEASSTEEEAASTEKFKMILGPTVIKFPWENGGRAPERKFPEPESAETEQMEELREELDQQDMEPVVHEEEQETKEEEVDLYNVTRQQNAWDLNPGIARYMHRYVGKPPPPPPSLGQTPQSQHRHRHHHHHHRHHQKRPKTNREKRARIADDLQQGSGSESDLAWDPEKKLEELAKLPGILLAKAKQQNNNQVSSPSSSSSDEVGN